jgi:hypothetical protein
MAHRQATPCCTGRPSSPQVEFEQSTTDHSQEWMCVIVSAYLVQAWDVRNSCKHNGAVLPLSAAPVGRGADGVDAMA